MPRRAVPTIFQGLRCLADLRDLDLEMSLKTCREFLQQGQCVQQDELFSSRFQDNMKRFTANFLSSGFGYFLTELKPVFILQSNTQ